MKTAIDGASGCYVQLAIGSLLCGNILTTAAALAASQSLTCQQTCVTASSMCTSSPPLPSRITPSLPASSIARGSEPATMGGLEQLNPQPAPSLLPLLYPASPTGTNISPSGASDVGQATAPYPLSVPILPSAALYGSSQSSSAPGLSAAASTSRHSTPGQLASTVPHEQQVGLINPNNVMGTPSAKSSQVPASPPAVHICEQRWECTGTGNGSPGLNSSFSFDAATYEALSSMLLKGACAAFGNASLICGEHVVEGDAAAAISGGNCLLQPCIEPTCTEALAASPWASTGQSTGPSAALQLYAPVARAAHPDKSTSSLLPTSAMTWAAAFSSPEVAAAQGPGSGMCHLSLTQAMG